MSNAVRSLFSRFAAQSSYAILLESPGEAGPLNQWTMMGFHPKQRIQLLGSTLSINGVPEEIATAEQLFDRLRDLFQQSQAWPHPELPFQGGWMGYLGYEFSRWCDPALASLGVRRKPNPAFPDLLFCEFEDWLLFNAAAQQLVILSDSPVREALYRGQWQALLANEEPSLLSSASLGEISPAYLSSFKSSFTPEGFKAAMGEIQKRITGGEIYQANLSLRLEKAIALDPYAVYEGLCQRNPSPFSGIFQWPEGNILCNSPERLVQLTPEGRVQTRPIAGTRGRGTSTNEDLAIGETLRSNEKERAEHLMLVDLERNDLGRICMPRSVDVNELLVLERYSHVTHLVSNVAGQLQPEKDAFDVLQAVFPGGTITGCPKLRCMEILHSLEPVSRGPYTGSLGYIDRATGAMDFNILIRSLYLTPQVPAPDAGAFVYNTAIHVGAGIVADSVGAFEYRECLRKAAVILGVLQQHDNNGKPVHNPV